MNSNRGVFCSYIWEEVKYDNNNNIGIAVGHCRSRSAHAATPLLSPILLLLLLIFIRVGGPGKY